MESETQIERILDRCTPENLSPRRVGAGIFIGIITYMSVIDMGFLDGLPAEWRSEVLEFLRGERREFSFVPEVEGTDFQRAVLIEMMKIPYGEVKSYGELARLAGYPRAARAVGSVCRNNKYPIIIPCHRVVASNGLGGYAFGLEMKKELLKIEGVVFS